MVEGAALEKQCALTGTEGSNPSLSATSVSVSTLQNIDKCSIILLMPEYYSTPQEQAFSSAAEHYFLVAPPEAVIQEINLVNTGLRAITLNVVARIRRQLIGAQIPASNSGISVPNQPPHSLGIALNMWSEVPTFKVIEADADYEVFEPEDE